MSFDGRAGTRGARQPWHGLMRRLNAMMVRRLRRKGGRTMGLDALVLTTVGRKSGQDRSTPVGSFPDRPAADGRRTWLVVASANGAADNPSWYYNLAANPSKARIEVGGQTVEVTAEQLHGSERDDAWKRVVAEAPRFARYPDKTDRVIPVLRLTERAEPQPG